MRNRRNLLWLVPLLLFLSSPFWKPRVADFLRPRSSLSEVGREGQTPQNFLLDSIVITLSSNGREEWEIHARRAFTGKTDQEIGMIEVNALYKGGKRKIVISSNRGTYFIDKRHLILIDNVVVRKPEVGEELRTELLHYYDATKMVVSPVDVDIKGPKFTLQAGRMDYDLSTDGYDFGGRVHVDL